MSKCSKSMLSIKEACCMSTPYIKLWGWWVRRCRTVPRTDAIITSDFQAQGRRTHASGKHDRQQSTIPYPN
eukprot:888884-Ditylum_brightwellii.AAC.1